ncbi:hypothetical protein DITRI_Ditri19aG0080300 [Diplodiscus trichospermus]
MGDDKGFRRTSTYSIFTGRRSSNLFVQVCSRFLVDFDNMGVRASKLNGLIGARRVKRVGFPPLTPKGYVPVCVGVNDDTRRFIVHTTTLRDADFLEMLCRSAEEYGFCNQGILRIPYEAKDFEEWIMRRDKRKIVRIN